MRLDIGKVTVTCILYNKAINPKFIGLIVNKIIE